MIEGARPVLDVRGLTKRYDGRAVAGVQARAADAIRQWLDDHDHSGEDPVTVRVGSRER